MKLVGKINVECIPVYEGMEVYDEHCVYELSDEERSFVPGRKKYLLNKRYSDYAMKNMDAEDLIDRALRESRYVYGVGFANTIEEAKMIFQNAVLQCLVIEYKEELKSIKKKINSLLSSVEKDVRFDFGDE